MTFPPLPPSPHSEGTIVCLKPSGLNLHRKRKEKQKIKQNKCYQISIPQSPLAKCF